MPPARSYRSDFGKVAGLSGGVPVPLQTRHAKHAEPDASGKLRGFATPSRKVELYSETFLDHGYPPLPDFEEPQIGPMTRPDLTGCLRLVEIEPFHVAAYIKALKVYDAGNPAVKAWPTMSQSNSMRIATRCCFASQGAFYLRRPLTHDGIDQGRVCARVARCSVDCTLRREWDRAWRRPADRPDVPRFIILPIRRDFVS